MTIDPQEESKRIEEFIRTTVRSRGFKRIIIACSGGVDSTTALYLAVGAIGKKNIFSLLLPYKTLHPHQLDDAKKAVKTVGIPSSQIEMIDIAPMVDAFAKNLSLKKKKDHLRLGNIMARTRMIVLYDRAKKHKALVLGTENKSESLLGYFTRFGDEASDIEPIRHLYKTQVYQLAEYLGVPEAILKKTPTAGLWPGQTDEGQFGFSYALADKILYGLYDKKKSIEQVVKEGFKRQDIQKVKDWINTNHFKHQLPIVYSV